MPSDDERIATAIDALYDRDTAPEMKKHAAEIVGYGRRGWSRQALVQRIASIQNAKHQILEKEACERLADCVLEVTAHADRT